MQPSRRTFLKTAAAGAGALWANPIQAQDLIEVRVHFMGLFVALDDKGKSYIASVRGKGGHHPAHSAVLAVDPRNIKSGGVGERYCTSDSVRAFEVSGELSGPKADKKVGFSYTKPKGSCPANEGEWQNPHWHVKLKAVGKKHKVDWSQRPEVDLKIMVESDAIAAEPPLYADVRKLQWQIGGVTQALTDRLLYVVKTRNPVFKDTGGALELKPYQGNSIDVYIATVPRHYERPPSYNIGSTLDHFAIGYPLLESDLEKFPKAVNSCPDVASDVKVPGVITSLYQCLFSALKPGVDLSRTVFCPGYSSYP